MRALIIVLLLATGCGTVRGFRSRAPACLSGSVPRVGRADADESYALLRREWTRGQAGDVVAATSLERAPALVPDASDLVREPACSTDLVDAIEGTIDRKPVAYSRMLVARIRAVGRVRDTTEVMQQKAAFLIAVASLTDAELTEYQLVTGEPGPPPPKAYVRRLALGLLAHSGMVANVAAVRPFLVEQLRTTTDEQVRVLVMLDGASRKFVDVAELARRIHAPGDAMANAIALRQLALLDDRGMALLDEIIAARGRLPISAGSAAATRDLLRTAIATRAAVRERALGVEPLFAAPHDRFDLTAWFDREPAGWKPSAAETARRVAQLDGELARLTRPEPRCFVLAELARWVPATEGNARFAAMTATADDDQCRIAAALALPGVDRGRRARFLIPIFAGESYAAARALAVHPDWLDDSPDLRAAVVAIAVAPLGGETTDRRALELQPAAEHVLTPAIARAWLVSIDAVAHDGNPTSIYATEVSAARMLAVAERAREFGLDGEARRLFARILTMPAPSPAARYTHVTMVKAAALAAAIVEAL
ncbi:MAG: hypothetical protein ABI867_24095 [Kofleriaceae bacterium]